MLCADARCPTDPNRSKHFLHKGLFHNSGTMPEPSRPQAIEDHFHNKSRDKNPSLARILRALQGFVQSHNWVFQVLFPQFQSRFSSHNVVFAFLVIEILSPVFGRLQFPEGSRFFDFRLAPLLPLPCSFLCSARPIPSSRCLQYFFADCMARGMPISVYQRRLPPVLRNVIDIDARRFGANFICSERQFLGTFPD